MSAGARAAHELVDRPPHLLSDDDARAVCALFDPSPLDYQMRYPGEPVLAAARASTVIRGAFARTVLKDSGFGQCVLLGAGLDTSVYRGLSRPEKKVWLVDRPAVLDWRRSLFSEAGVDDPGIPVGVDLSGHDLLPALVEAGFDESRPAVIACLGLTMYLPPQDVAALLARLASVASGSELVFDTVLPPSRRDQRGHAYTVSLAAGLNSSGEPWLSAPTFDTLTGWLDASGWEAVRRVSETEAAPPLFWEHNPQLQPMRLVTLLHARRGLEPGA